MSACESSSCMNTRTQTHTHTQTDTPPPTSLTACCDAEWRLLIKLTDRHWQRGQSAADKGEKKHWFYNAPNHNNKQPTGHEQCSTQDHQPCFWPFWCCVTDGWATPAYASLTLPGNRALTIHWSATLIPPFKYFVGLLEQLWWGMNSKKKPSEVYDISSRSFKSCAGEERGLKARSTEGWTHSRNYSRDLRSTAMWLYPVERDGCCHQEKNQTKQKMFT